MTDERATFESTKARLEEILVQVKKKDTSLEQSLDLLEEGVRLANTCNELIDQTSWRKSAEGEEAAEGGQAEGDAGGEATAEAAGDAESGEPAEDAELEDEAAEDGQDDDEPASEEPADVPIDDERS